MRVNDLKFMIELAIGKDRGYATESLTAEWASAAAEEIEKMINGAQSIENIRADDIGAQLAKLFANTICTSAQYNINLSRFYQSAKLDVDLAANFSEEYHLELAKDIPHPEVASLIRHYTRDLVSTLARYHGWNHESDPTPLGESISHIHALIFHLAKEFQLDLLDHLNRVVHRARMNSESLHVETYHPTTAQNLEYFAPIKENTVCIFSRSAFTWGARLFDSGKSLQANLHSNIGTFSRFCRATAHEDIDAFLFMFPGHYGTCLDQLSNFAKTCLLFFSDHDPKEEHCLKQISSQNWRFRFNGMPNVCTMVRTLLLSAKYPICDGSQSSLFAIRF